jgi:hypothetical protein
MYMKETGEESNCYKHLSMFDIVKIYNTGFPGKLTTDRLPEALDYFCR